MAAAHGAVCGVCMEDGRLRPRNGVTRRRRGLALRRVCEVVNMQCSQRLGRRRVRQHPLLAAVVRSSGEEHVEGGGEAGGACAAR